MKPKASARTPWTAVALVTPALRCLRAAHRHRGNYRVHRSRNVPDCSQALLSLPFSFISSRHLCVRPPPGLTSLHKRFLSASHSAVICGEKARSKMKQLATVLAPDSKQVGTIKGRNSQRDEGHLLRGYLPNGCTSTHRASWDHTHSASCCQSPCLDPHADQRQASWHLRNPHRNSQNQPTSVASGARQRSAVQAEH